MTLFFGQAQFGVPPTQNDLSIDLHKPQLLTLHMLVRLTLLILTSLQARGEVCPQLLNSPSDWKNLAGFANSVKDVCNSITIKLDAKKLLAIDETAPLPCAPPFKATFSKDGRALTFFATRHLSGSRSLKDPDLGWIKQEIEKRPPTEVFVEFPSESAESKTIPKDALRVFERNCTQGDKFTCPEGNYAAILALKSGISVTAGEPSPNDVMPELAKKISMQDLYAFESTKALSTLHAMGLKPEQWPNHLMPEVRKTISEQNGPWSYSIFQTWLRERMGTQVQIDALATEKDSLEPRKDAKASAIQKISYEVDKVRESLLLQETEKLVNRSKNVLVVYGSGHYQKQLPALSDAFGPPKIECTGK